MSSHARSEPSSWHGIRAIYCIGLFLASSPAALLGQSSSPAARLAAAQPQLFAASSLVDGVVGGQTGARVVVVTETQRRLGFQPDDVILAVEGRALGSETWKRAALPDTATYTVWHRMLGERLVLEPAEIGRQVVEEFVALPKAERTPIRLAVMLANQRTLVRDGAGVVLLPPEPRFDDARWLRVATPLPQPSEVAIREIAEALLEGLRLTNPYEVEVRAAGLALRSQAFPESEERARNAIVLSVVDPEARLQPDDLQEATRIYLAARSEQQRDLAEGLVPESRWAIFAQGSVNGIQAFLPQNTLLQVDGSRGFGFAAGARVRAPLDIISRLRDRPVLRQLFLGVSYAQARNEFKYRGERVVDTTVQSGQLDLSYRPEVASRLRPFLTAGAGVYRLEGSVHCRDSNGVLTGEVGTAVVQTAPGWLLGGGLDWLYVRSIGLRSAIFGHYRVLRYSFFPEDAPLWICAKNTPLDFNFENHSLEDNIYKLRMDGWQAGVEFGVGF